MAYHWLYSAFSANFMLLAIAICRSLTLALIRLVGAFTRDELRHKRCVEILRLASRDAWRPPSRRSRGTLERPDV